MYGGSFLEGKITQDTSNATTTAAASPANASALTWASQRTSRMLARAAANAAVQAMPALS
jgi:hypothetical protein